MAEEIRRLEKTEPPRKGLIPVIIDLDWANLETHPVAAQFPMADKLNQEKLKQSIKLNGIKPDEPLVLRRHEDKLKIGDGRNRHFCGNEVGYRWKQADFREFVGTDAEFEAFVRERNTRRHMTAEEREAHVEWLLDQYPNMPSRKLAGLAICSHTKITQMRKEREEAKSQREKEDIKTYDALVKAWNGASLKQQEQFVRDYRIDLADMLRG